MRTADARTEGQGFRRCDFGSDEEMGGASTENLLREKFRHDKRLRWTSRLGKPDGEGKDDGRMVQGMGGEAAR